MLNAFRQFTKSRTGLILVFIVLGFIALAFAASDITGIRSASGGGAGGVLAKVGGRNITEADVRRRLDLVMDNLRQSGRSMTMAELIAQGGVEYAVEDAITSIAAEEFARKHGVVVSTRLIDGEISTMPDFRTVDGKFDQKKFEAAMGQRGLTPQRVRELLTEARYVSWMLNRDLHPPQLPKGVLLPYASLQLEQRTGAAALVRRADMEPGADPDDKALAAYYNANKARYSIPERRVLTYAIVRPDQFKEQATATEADIADAYKRSGTRYVATEKRTVRQLVLGDQATANAVVADVKGGKSLPEAAASRGLEARGFEDVEKAALAGQTSAPIADAAFAAAQGGVVGPVRSPLGWIVVHVEKVTAIPAKSLDEARAEIGTEIAKRNEINALANMRQTIDDGIGDGRTFAELMRDTKLTVARTASLTAAGVDPDDAASKADPALAEVIRAGFAGSPEEREPQLVPVGAEGGFAVVSIDKVTPAAPRPIATVREKVLADYRVDEQLKKARAVADAIAKKIAAGTPFAQAVVEGGANRVPAERFTIRRREVRPELPVFVRAAFQIGQGKTKVVPAADGSGFYITWLEKVEEHDASGDAVLMGQANQVLGEQASRERSEQFLAAIKKDLGTSQNKEAIDRFKAGLTGSGN